MKISANNFIVKLYEYQFIDLLMNVSLNQLSHFFSMLTFSFQLKKTYYGCEMILKSYWLYFDFDYLSS